MATILTLLERKTREEQEKLKRKIELQLQKDILKIYTESIFSDVLINVGNNPLKLHRCILQTRAPILYNIYCHNPNLINVIPVQKLEVFFRDIYSPVEIRQKEEEILKCIDTAFSSDKDLFTQEDSGLENSEYTNLPASSSPKPSAPEDTSKYIGNRFETSNNTLYYSLVDESLVLSDFSDIHDEGVKEMSGCSGEGDSCTVAKITTANGDRRLDKPIFQNGKSDGEPSANVELQKSGKLCTFFIDASNLTDESETSLGDLNHATECTANAKNDVKVDIKNGPDDRRQDSENKVRVQNQTPDSLDDDPYDGEGSVQTNNTKLQDDFAEASKKAESAGDLATRYNEDLLKTLYPELMLELSFSDKVKYSGTEDVIEFQPTSEALKNFKNYLMEKYESLKGDRAAVDLKHLNIFDELIGEDKQFLLLKYNLEEILSARSATKTEIAEHKFLYNEYERKHGPEKTYNFIKSFAISTLHRVRETRPAPKPEKYDQTPDSLNDEPRSCDSETNPPPPECPPKPREPITNKSCGFFIDLKENDPVPPPKAAETKDKSLPSKQLFSMFIDFGTSTDSDSSIGMQNKFERRKKQYFNKLEKSRELRNSASSLNDVNENIKSDKLTKSSTAVPVSTNAVTAAATVTKPNTEIIQSEHSAVIRRPKNNIPNTHSNRRSWNVDKTAEINQNISRHKRSYSVSSHKEVDITPQTRPNTQLIEKEYPSIIGNADSTNELTVNGESEISSSHSCSEQDKENKTPCNSNSNESSQKCSDKSLKTDENENIDKSKDSFVKLSDMDKEPKIPISTEKWVSQRMTKSATGTENWFETKLLSGSANSRSLSRIFPDISASILSKPNSDVDDTTISSISSVQSSSAVSTCESNFEVSNAGNKNEISLGQDLLRMFLDEISPDVVIEVAGRRIKAHKCILTSRCQYFAALLSGGWVESAGNVLSIHGFSYSVVHFALCYIYSGESEIPETLNIVELATLADMLCLEGLKEVVSYTLKMKYCHFFHKPCNVCSVGVLECLPVAVNYGLDEIHRKSLRWINKHYVRLWCSKAFASLPRELIDKCYNQHVVMMSVNNVFETLMNCDKLFSFIPQTRWAEPCFIVTKRLHDHSIKYLANHFVEFLKSDSFSLIAQNRTWGIMIVDEKTQLACAKMRAEQLCQSYSHVSSQLKIATANENEEFIELLNRVKQQVESALIKSALQASQCSAWFQMEPELRSHIQTSAGLTFVPEEIKRRVSSFKPRQSTTPSSGSRAVDLQQVKSAINRQQRQNGIRSESKSGSSQKHESKSGAGLKHESKTVGGQKQVNGQLRNSTVKQTSSSSTKTHKSSTASGNSKSPFRNKYSNVKSRYMDRKNSKEKPTSETTPSETSEIEKNPTSANKRPSKSLVTSAHLSPAIRQSARAVSLSKIPVSVRTSSQKRTESDKDTTSGSDNGLRSERSKRQHSSASESAPPRKPLSTLVKNGTNSRTYHSTPMRKSAVTRSRVIDDRTKTSAKKPSRSTENVRSSKKLECKRADDSDDLDRLRTSDDCSQATKCTENNPSTETSISEEVAKPAFRRDGTFCIDEPTVLKRQSPSVEQADIV